MASHRRSSVMPIGILSGRTKNGRSRAGLGVHFDDSASSLIVFDDSWPPLNIKALPVGIAPPPKDVRANWAPLPSRLENSTASLQFIDGSSPPDTPEALRTVGNLAASHALPGQPQRAEATRTRTALGNVSLNKPLRSGGSRFEALSVALPNTPLLTAPPNHVQRIYNDNSGAERSARGSSNSLRRGYGNSSVAVPDPFSPLLPPVSALVDAPDPVIYSPRLPFSFAHGAASQALAPTGQPNPLFEVETDDSSDPDSPELPRSHAITSSVLCDSAAVGGIPRKLPGMTSEQAISQAERRAATKRRAGVAVLCEPHRAFLRSDVDIIGGPFHETQPWSAQHDIHNTSHCVKPGASISAAAISSSGDATFSNSLPCDDATATEATSDCSNLGAFVRSASPAQQLVQPSKECSETATPPNTVSVSHPAHDDHSDCQTLINLKAVQSSQLGLAIDGGSDTVSGSNRWEADMDVSSDSSISCTPEDTDMEISSVTVPRPMPTNNEHDVILPGTLEAHDSVTSRSDVVVAEAACEPESLVQNEAMSEHDPSNTSLSAVSASVNASVTDDRMVEGNRVTDTSDGETAPNDLATHGSTDMPECMGSGINDNESIPFVSQDCKSSVLLACNESFVSAIFATDDGDHSCLHVSDVACLPEQQCALNNDVYEVALLPCQESPIVSSKSHIFTPASASVSPSSESSSSTADIVKGDSKITVPLPVPVDRQIAGIKGVNAPDLGELVTSDTTSQDSMAKHDSIPEGLPCNSTKHPANNILDQHKVTLQVLQSERIEESVVKLPLHSPSPMSYGAFDSPADVALGSAVDQQCVVAPSARNKTLSAERSWASSVCSMFDDVDINGHENAMSDVIIDDAAAVRLATGRTRECVLNDINTGVSGNVLIQDDTLHCDTDAAIPTAQQQRQYMLSPSRVCLSLRAHAVIQRGSLANHVPNVVSTCNYIPSSIALQALDGPTNRGVIGDCASREQLLQLHLQLLALQQEQRWGHDPGLSSASHKNQMFCETANVNEGYETGSELDGPGQQLYLQCLADDAWLNSSPVARAAIAEAEIRIADALAARLLEQEALDEEIRQSNLAAQAELARVHEEDLLQQICSAPIVRKHNQYNADDVSDLGEHSLNKKIVGPHLQPLSSRPWPEYTPLSAISDPDRMHSLLELPAVSQTASERGSNSNAVSQHRESQEQQVDQFDQHAGGDYDYSHNAEAVSALDASSSVCNMAPAVLVERYSAPIAAYSETTEYLRKDNVSGCKRQRVVDQSNDGVSPEVQDAAASRTSAVPYYHRPPWAHDIPGMTTESSIDLSRPTSPPLPRPSHRASGAISTFLSLLQREPSPMFMPPTNTVRAADSAACVAPQAIRASSVTERNAHARVCAAALDEGAGGWGDGHEGVDRPSGPVLLHLRSVGIGGMRPLAPGTSALSSAMTEASKHSCIHYDYDYVLRGLGEYCDAAAVADAGVAAGADNPKTFEAEPGADDANAAEDIACRRRRKNARLSISEM